MFLKRYIYIKYQIFRFMFGKNKLYRGKVTKSPSHIWRELVQWFFRENDLNTMYYAYGLNEAGTNQSDYAGTKELLNLRKSMEAELIKQNGNRELSYDILTKDKFVANSFFMANHIPCIPHIGIISRGIYIDTENAIHPILSIFAKQDTLILKNPTLEAGDGVLYCQKIEDHFIINGIQLTLEDFQRKVKRGVWLVQPLISSHSQLKKINATALNTTRIVTILDGDKPVYLAGFQAFATNNATTDSWNKGSIYVGIDIDKGCLKKYGYHNLSEKDKSIATEHLDSRIVFEDFPIPFLQEAVDLCIKAHRLLFFNFMVGFDIAITDEGPMIVEANEKPGMNVVQCTDGGLRKSILGYAKNTKKYLN